jgi:hypothetical protein
MAASRSTASTPPPATAPAPPTSPNSLPSARDCSARAAITSAPPPTSAPGPPSWTATPVLPETIDNSDLSIVDQSSQLRPEYANSAFDLWRITGNPAYKRGAWRWFENMRAHQRVAGGHTLADEVSTS